MSNQKKPYSLIKIVGRLQELGSKRCDYSNLDKYLTQTDKFTLMNEVYTFLNCFTMLLMIQDLLNNTYH